jgi:hypothetical protein
MHVHCWGSQDMGWALLGPGARAGGAAGEAGGRGRQAGLGRLGGPPGRGGL